MTRKAKNKTLISQPKRRYLTRIAVSVETLLRDKLGASPQVFPTNTEHTDPCPVDPAICKAFLASVVLTSPAPVPELSPFVLAPIEEDILSCCGDSEGVVTPVGHSSDEEFQYIFDTDPYTIVYADNIDTPIDVDTDDPIEVSDEEVEHVPTTPDLDL